MKRIISIVLVLLATHLCISTAASDVVTENLKLFVDGKEFFIKAMCYNPAPLGQGVRNRNGTIGAGFCSPKVSPFGNVITTCYDSDYFDGGSDASDREQPTQGGWFQPLWQRDFPIIKSLGANTIRLYNANPTTRQASIYFPEVVLLPLGKDHVPFMDAAQQNGLKVIFPLISDYGMLTTYPESTFKRLLRWQIDELGNHPALLMWGFGNELPLDQGNVGLVNLMNKYITYIKQYTFTKWGRKVPLTTAVVDLPMSYDFLAATLDVDIFTTNAGYRGFTLTDLWSGNAQNQGWFKLSCRYNKPVFIGEINWHSLDNAITYEHPNWFNQIWKDVVEHIDQGCIGGAFFEYSDEKLKEDPLQRTMGVVKFEVNNAGPLPSTELNSWTPDIATPKDIIFAAVQSGSHAGKFFNMNSSPFHLVNRPQSSLGSSAPICNSFNFATCPGQNTCSFKGRCDRQTGTCACNPGWTGADCSQAACPNSCSGKGTCVGAVSPPVCSCQPGWTGPSCSVQVSASSCGSNCVDGNGRCDSTGKCVCFRGWWGHDCALPDVSYPPTSSTPSSTPTQRPATQSPTQAPTQPATQSPTQAPTQRVGTQAPSTPPTAPPTQAATTRPTVAATIQPTAAATTQPTKQATAQPTQQQATSQPTTQPTKQATSQPTQQPTSQPTNSATTQPTSAPSGVCGSLQSCGNACYSSQTYTCFDGFLCPVPTQRCGTTNTCYDTTKYTCSNNQLVAK